MKNIFNFSTNREVFSAFVVIVYLVIVVIYMFATHIDKSSRLRAVTKALLMPLLALIYYLYAVNFNILVVIALICGWLGDILPLPFPGAIPFGIGHLIYAFILGKIIDFSVLAPVHYLLPILVFLILLGYVYSHLRSSIKTLKEKISVICYMVLISVMGIFSLLLFASTFLTVGFFYRYLFIALGGLLFVISDSILSERLFIKDAIPKDLAVVITYLLAQSLLSLGFILI